MRSLPISRLPEGPVDEISVIAGGPSLSGYDVKRAPGLRIGASGSGLRAGCELTIGAGSPFITELHSEIAQALDEGRRVFHPIRPHLRERWELPKDIDERVELLRWNRGVDLCRDGFTLYGFDSGFLCVLAALYMRPRRINLLGLDYTSPGVDRHWHKGYSIKSKRYDAQLFAWVKQYDTLRELLPSGVEIVHYVGGEFGSRLTAFRRAPIAEILGEMTCA